MEKNMNSKTSMRDAIKNRLKGTLSAWKLDPNALGDRKQSVSDRTPEPGITKTHFDTAFSLGRKIGQGASGAVYLCKNNQDGEQYAVKVSRGDQQLLRISKKTYKILKNLNSPLLIRPKCLYLNEVNEKIHFVMEYCPYSSLADLIDVLTISDKKKIISQVLRALAYLHEQGVCHRDIKLQNILYDPPSGQLKIIDFGICKRVKSTENELKQKMWTITGTLQYMAPEILSGMDYDESVDCWALGILTYRLFYGRFPFESEYKSDNIHQICSAEPQYPQQDFLLNNFIKHLLTKNPSNRMTAQEGLHHPWIETPSQKIRLGSQADIEIITNRLRNHSCIGTQEVEEQAASMKTNKKHLISELKRNKDIFYHKKARMQTKMTQSESSPESKHFLTTE